MQVVEEFRSPDGLLAFRIIRTGDGDLSLGFEGYSWHTHADILAAVEGMPEEDAVKCFVSDLVNGRAIIAIARVNGEIRDVWIADEAVPDRYKPEEETIEFRFWDGTPAR